MRFVSRGLACLVLAAGGGRRLGGGKLLLPWRGKPLVIHPLETATGSEIFTSITVVLGHGAADLRRVITEHFPNPPPTFRLVENEAWRDGQSTSLRLGLNTILSAPADAGATGAMVMLGDQPLVRADTLVRLSDAHAAALARDPAHPATVPMYQGKRGNPVVLSRSLFPEVMTLAGDVGARNILAALGDRVLGVPVEDPGVLRDVDTPEAYAGLDCDGNRVIY